MQKLVLALIVAAVAQGGCSSQSSSSTVIVTPSSVTVVDDADAVAWEGAFLWVASMPMDPALTLQPSAAASSLYAALTPPGCASATVTNNVVLLTMNGCAGPFGISGATGGVSFTFTETNGPVITANASNLQIGGGNLTINASGVFRGFDNGRILTVTTNGAGVGPNGSSVARQGTYTITWDVGDVCATFDGSVSAGGVNIETTTLSSYLVCATGCPRSGTITATEPATGSTFTTSYNGTASVTVVGSNGTQTITALSCD